MLCWPQHLLSLDVPQYSGSGEFNPASVICHGLGFCTCSATPRRCFLNQKLWQIAACEKTALKHQISANV